MPSRSRSIGVRAVALATIAQFLTLSCGGKQAPKGPGAAGVGGAPLIQTGDAPPGMTLRLSDGRQGPPAADRSRLAPATRLADAEADELLKRLAPIGAKPDDKVDFALRDRSLPPPRTGKTIKAAFPPPPSAAAPPATADAGKPLTVVRWAPEGDVPLAPQLQITFSQPMIAVTSQDDAARTVPVTLTPTPPGRWRWLGTKTLVFDPEVRFPQATTYTVEIAKGTTSATGNVLADGQKLTFTTPAPRAQTMWPDHGPQRLDAPMFVLFDQKIDPAAVLATITVKAGGKTYATRLLTEAEIAAHETVKSLVDSAKANQQDGRWLAFRAIEAFPKDSSVVVSIGPGTPSAEGPGRTKDAQGF
ncbi:MAG TPA: Ig-like domain-containing protein, partial [Kofleriaceae bacterium]|nr:Ig-like domain-containing protein [Kofleriaceae bacterium]